MHSDPSVVQGIRVASRDMVRELGFMNTTLAATDYPPSAVHALLEIEAQGSLSATQLVQLLGLEKSSVSRMLAKLVDAGELAESSSSEDARAKRLYLTEKGTKTVQAINNYGDERVMAALKKLDNYNQ
ncbi:MarR family transcriptional regulator, partial [Cronobacter dublinensis subsp. dublinensis]|nr:MarR family transcriptional regulator [Cronobacter dublinensis subsp. dublinensis]EGT5671107.1 MarR family transcriptional regulator [Cronobacter dublinensis subsp. dublinensis]EGT5675289.1 MarR family transcriptional regulator [Cronobacter dublinensis subsp. dublinensis]EGT5679448.1 MarR family transcriptional regulator [Cronobacter dublinensis subsp. dublinensis]EGT5687900.1 MarR family transcriptional regulator [Cronobacter dublinensis subsp. dublinensis]